MRKKILEGELLPFALNDCFTCSLILRSRLSLWELVKQSNPGILESVSNRRGRQEKHFDEMNVDYSDFEDNEGTNEKIFLEAEV